jgi:hypothetical protein
MSNSMLPHTVGYFRLIGSRQVFEKGRIVDPIWYKIIEKDTNTISGIDLIFAKKGKSVFSDGESKFNGERVVVKGTDFIRFPGRSPRNGLNRSDTVLLPCRIGRYRLKKEEFENAIELWE